jgi:hypothetical protein
MYANTAKMKKFILLFLIALVLSSIVVSAHEEEEMRIDERIRTTSVQYLLIAGSIAALFVILSLRAAKQPHFSETKKRILFLGIVIPIVIVTAYLVTATVFLNSISETKGPVHWHADYEIWACGNKITMKEPTGLSNKVGTAVFHHHGDNRIHVEGVLVNTEDAALHEFFEVTGGELTKTMIGVPTNYEYVKFTNGDKCNGDVGELQAFLYKTIDGVATQEKLDDFTEYVLSPYSNVPPGDCIIIEFDKEKEKTNHLCETYKIAKKKAEEAHGS